MAEIWSVNNNNTCPRYLGLMSEAPRGLAAGPQLRVENQPSVSTDLQQIRFLHHVHGRLMTCISYLFTIENNTDSAC